METLVIMARTQLVIRDRTNCCGPARAVRHDQIVENLCRQTLGRHVPEFRNNVKIASLIVNSNGIELVRVESKL